jgi:hypothetical protein
MPRMTSNESEQVPSVPTPPAAEPSPAVQAEPAAPPVAPAAPAAATPYAAAPAQYPAAPAQYQAPGQYPAAPGQYPGGYGNPAPYGGYAPPVPKALSITSMATGIAGIVFSFFGFGLLPAIAGVVFGHIAQRREPTQRGFWITGLITGYVGVGISLITGLAILAAILIPLIIIGSEVGSSV